MFRNFIGGVITIMMLIPSIHHLLWRLEFPDPLALMGVLALFGLILIVPMVGLFYFMKYLTEQQRLRRQ